ASCQRARSSPWLNRYGSGFVSRTSPLPRRSIGCQLVQTVTVANADRKPVGLAVRIRGAGVVVELGILNEVHGRDVELLDDLERHRLLDRAVEADARVG